MLQEIDATPARPWQDGVGIVLGAAATMIYVGYNYGSGAHTEYIPWIRHLADPGAFARDWIITSPAYHENMLRFMAYLSKLIILPQAFLIIHSLTALLFVGTIFLISQKLFKDRMVFYATLFLLLHWGLDTAGAQAVGGNTLFSYQFAPHVVAVPFCILAFYFFVDERYVNAALFAGLATNIHFLLGSITMMIIAGYLIFSAQSAGKRRMWLPFLAYGLAAAFTIIPVFYKQITMAVPLQSRLPFTEIMAQMRAPHHYLPTTWPWSSYARFLTFLLIALAGVRHKPAQGMHRRVTFLCGSIIFLCLIGTVFVEVWPVDLITKLQFFRMLIFVKLFAFMYAANYLVITLDDGEWPVCWATLCLFLADHYLLIALLACLLAGYHLRHNPYYRGVLWATSGLLFIVLMAALALQAQQPAWQGLAVGWEPMMMVLVGGSILAISYHWARASWLSSKPRRATALALLMLLVLTMDTAWSWHRHGLSHYFRYDLKAVTWWDRMSEWVSGNTPQDALFITPPYIGGFRVYAGRAIVSDFAVAPLWDKDFPEWKHRLEDICGGTPLHCRGLAACGETMRAGYFNLREEGIRRLAGRYEADYFVCERRDDLPFAMVYSNPLFMVFKLR
ncbi:MAG: hypothetical protein HYR55_03950 [Acidobacteria bacterium]|nr:hypothetical protein [Acidobacteriota bacterium]MBI3657613.1 hypothetical protein [Acidobacteriota bacterium]